MRWRGPAVVVLLLSSGLAGGYAASLSLTSPAPTSGVPDPVLASPRIPVDPAATIRPDPPIAPLGTDLEMRTARLGMLPFRLSFPVPRGWQEVASDLAEKKWNVADNPPYTYVLRVEVVRSDNLLISSTMDRRISDLGDQEEDAEVLSRTSDTLRFTYVADGYLRYGVLRWLDLNPSGGADPARAEVEVAVTGREADLAGMQALIEKVSTGMTQG